VKLLKEASPQLFSSVKYVLTDIDDTLTEQGRLLPEAFNALWELHKRGILVIPVTGRPAGWCDCIVRQWPVAAVVGENGAFAYYLEKGRRKEILHPLVAPKDRKKLEDIKEKVLREIPGSRVAGDQPFRIYDLAIDFAEEEPVLGLEVAERIVSICKGQGAEAKISSIHVNTWFGTYNKVSMSVHLLKDFFRLSDLDKVVFFCGDSPNDEPMFEKFPLSCATANITPLLPYINTMPAFITEAPYGRGFAEAAGILINRG